MSSNNLLCEHCGELHHVVEHDQCARGHRLLGWVQLDTSDTVYLLLSRGTWVTVGERWIEWYNPSPGDRVGYDSMGRLVVLGDREVPQCDLIPAVYGRRVRHLPTGEVAIARGGWGQWIEVDWPHRTDTRRWLRDECRYVDEPWGRSDGGREVQRFYTSGTPPGHSSKEEGLEKQATDIQASEIQRYSDWAAIPVKDILATHCWRSIQSLQGDRHWLCFNTRLDKAVITVSARKEQDYRFEIKRNYEKDLR